MTYPPGERHEHTDLALFYALGALPTNEAQTAAAHIPTCLDCRQTLEALRPAIEACAAWSADVLRPPARLWDRLAQRIAADTGQEPLSALREQWVEPEWKEVAPGIACKVFANDPDNHRVSMLVRLAPGTDYPPHHHDHVEELHLLDGELIVNGRTFYPGDYRRAEPGTLDHRVWSETGCTCVLITSARDALL